MQKITKLTYQNESKQEYLPNMKPDFPIITSSVQLHKEYFPFAPWHWHNEFELFYQVAGSVEYSTSKGKIAIPEGGGALINSNVLHMTRPTNDCISCLQWIHVFHSTFVSGQMQNRIYKKYLEPLIGNADMELIPLYPDCKEHQAILEQLKTSFALDDQSKGYELRLQGMISQMYLDILHLPEVEEGLSHKKKISKMDDQLKRMMIYIHENYDQKLEVAEIASIAYISERECYRIFNKTLQLTPMDYVNHYRLQQACEKLKSSQESVTRIGLSCGFNHSSYFGKLFKEMYGCTPSEYRKKLSVLL